METKICFGGRWERDDVSLLCRWFRAFARARADEATGRDRSEEKREEKIASDLPKKREEKTSDVDTRGGGGGGD